jgi:hypothetical protein
MEGMDPVTLLNTITYIVTIASIAVRLTPSTKDDEIVGKLLKALKVLSIAPKEEVKK